MSAHEQIGATSWAFTFARRVITHRWKKLQAFARLNFDILCRPAKVGAEVILDNDPAGVLHALKYYSKMFALGFAIHLIASRFWLWEGLSEWRDVVTLALQVLVAVVFIYVLCLTLPDRVPFLRLVQATLYTDGLYLIFTATVSIPISYLTLVVPSANREIDIFATEYERCLAHNSTFYWLLRGDLKYYLYNDIWKPADWANWLFDNFDYVLFIPFVFIFVIMLRPARKTSFILIFLFTAAAYVAVVEGNNALKRKLGFWLAVQDTKCTLGHLDPVINNYAPTLVARQIAYKINNTSRISNTYFAPLTSRGIDLVQIGTLKPTAEPNWQFFSTISAVIHQAYCSESNPYWVAARRINARLIHGTYDHRNKLLYQQIETPKDCPTWPTPK